jgi:hypothetical protein
VCARTGVCAHTPGADTQVGPYALPRARELVYGRPMAEHILRPRDLGIIMGYRCPCACQQWRAGSANPAFSSKLVCAKYGCAVYFT